MAAKPPTNDSRDKSAKRKNGECQCLQKIENQGQSIFLSTEYFGIKKTSSKKFLETTRASNGLFNVLTEKIVEKVRSVLENSW